MTRSNSSRSGPTMATTPGRVDPSFLLTRGHAARLLPLKPPGLGFLQALSTTEVDKDLRHMQAYHNAVLQYQQQFYWQTNQGDPSVLPLPTSSSTLPSPHTMVLAAVPPALPVRIDPDEEKRQTLLQAKIQKAECLREQAEQTYVAQLAHYVQTGQDLQQLLGTAERHLYFLQQVVHARAKTVALLRARLHMTRDVLHSLTARGALLEQVLATQGDGGDAVLPNRTPAIPEDDAMLQVWNQLESDFQKAVVQCRQISADDSTKRSKKDALVPWPATQLPATPYGVPLLLSALSDAPEKSLSWNCGGMFGSHTSSMSWIEPHLASAEQDNETSPEEELQSLQAEVEFLTRELTDERQVSQTTCRKIGAVRTQQDEWVAMMALVRQETEAVLHRHHVIMQSNVAMEAAERLYKKQQEEEELLKAEDEAAGKSEGAAEGGDEEGATDVPPVEAAAVDVANDGDDEGSNTNDDEEEEEDHHGAAQENWAAGSKRSSSADENDSSPTGRSKRRRM